MMILLDTCVLIFDALSPKQLSLKATTAIREGEEKKNLYCCDISLWEIAMLIQKKRLDPGTEIETFLQLTLRARGIQVLSITPEIAALATTPILNHQDPADRIIAGTSLFHRAKLITCDNALRKISSLNTIW